MRKVKGVMEMTEKREDFLAKLKEFKEIYGYTPTVRELGKYVGLNSPATVKYYLDLLEKLGKIKRINNRNIEIME